MCRFTAGHLAIIATLALTACGLKPAGTAVTGAAGTSAGGGSGAGGVGGSIGGGGGAGTMKIPVINLDGGGEGSNPDLNCGARSKTAEKVAPDILILLDRSLSMNDNINSQMCRPDGGIGTGWDCGMQ